MTVTAKMETNNNSNNSFDSTADQLLSDNESKEVQHPQQQDCSHDGKWLKMTDKMETNNNSNNSFEK